MHRKVFFVVCGILLAIFLLNQRKSESPSPQKFNDSLDFANNKTYPSPPNEVLQGKTQSIEVSESHIDSDSTPPKKIDPNIERKGDSPPHSFNELFPGLKAYEWEFMNELQKGTDISKALKMRKLQAKFVRDPYEGRLTKLIEIKQGSFLSFSGEDFLSRLNFESKSQKKLKHLYQNKVAYKNLTEIPQAEIPICIFNLSQDSLIYEIETFAFFVKKVEFPIENYPGFEGVRIIYDSSKAPANFLWLESIECIVSTQNSIPSRYKDLQLLHLLATVGIQGWMN